MNDVDRFVDGLRLQREKYREISRVVEDQKKALAASDVDALLGVVERKRTLLADIESLERELAPVKAKWAEIRAGLDAERIGRVEAAVEETRTVLQELVRLEDEARAVMERQREMTADDLKDLMLKRKARGAYGGPAGNDPRFIDGSK